MSVNLITSVMTVVLGMFRDWRNAALEGRATDRETEGDLGIAASAHRDVKITLVTLRREGVSSVPDPNRLLRAARERAPSRTAPGEPASRQEIAEAVNAFLWRETGRRYEFDAHHLAKLERGVIGWPTAPYRSALRAVLRASCDEELGFRTSRRARPASSPVSGLWSSELAAPSWEPGGIAAAVDETTRTDLINRRDVLVGATTVTGSALLGPLSVWLEPLRAARSGTGSAFNAIEVEALERVVQVFRGWSRSTVNGLARSAVVGQLHELAGQLRHAPAGPRTDRAFLAGAELAKIAGSMSFDAGLHGAAQRYYIMAVQLAKAAGSDTLAAVALAALARQLFDLLEPDDGLEIVALAQYGTRHTATPGLRALLHTREAWGHALRGCTNAVHKAVSLAEEAYAQREPKAEPRWTNGMDAAELAGVIGARYRDLARHDPAQAPKAARYIGQALVLRDASRQRNRVFDLVGLARVHLITGEPEQAAALIGQVMPLAGERVPGRVGRKLGDFYRETAPWATVPAVGDARERLRPLLTV
jgi:hypothetical protein